MVPHEPRLDRSTLQVSNHSAFYYNLMLMIQRCRRSEQEAALVAGTVGGEETKNWFHKPTEQR